VNWLGAELIAQWPGLAGGGVAAVEAVRRDLDDPGGRGKTERRYFISSIGGTGAARITDAVRGHWSVENRLHWNST